MKHRRWKIPSQRPSQQDEVTRGVPSPPITYTILAVARKGRLNCFMKLHAHMPIDTNYVLFIAQTLRTMFNNICIPESGRRRGETLSAYQSLERKEIRNLMDGGT